MRYLFSFSLFLLLFSSTAAFAQTDYTAKFDPIVQAVFTPELPGCAVVVTQKGTVLYQKAFGMANLELNVPMQPDMVFRIGSVTKQFTAMAILQLVEQGKLGLQDDLTKYVPDYPNQGKRITVEQLLQHTSGIKNYTDMLEWTAEVQTKDLTPMQLIDLFKNQDLDFEPGTQWNYSNSGYILLGYIIEKVSGQSYGDYLTAHFFKPLGMKNSYYGGNNNQVIPKRLTGYKRDVGSVENANYLSMTQPYAAGSILSTVGDLAIWTKAMHTGKVVKKDLFQKAITPCILPDGTDTKYGYGLSIGTIQGSPTVEHSGGIHGFRSDLIYLPKEDICVAVMTNSEFNSPGDVAARLAAAAIGKTYTPPAITLTTKALAEYIGVYQDEKKMDRVITLEGNGLYWQRTGGSRLKIVPYAPDQFYFENALTMVTFIRDDKTKAIIQAIISDRTSDKKILIKTDKSAPEPRQEIRVAAAQLDKYAGQYELAPGFILTISSKDGQLFGQATGQPQFEMFAETATHFFLKVTEAAADFVVDAAGAVNQLIWNQGGQTMTAKRVK